MLVIFKVKLPSIIEKFLGEMANMPPLGIGHPRWVGDLQLDSEQPGPAHRCRDCPPVLVPMAGLSVAVAGFRRSAGHLMAMFASPSTVSSYTMAMQMDGDGELAGQLVVFATVFSIITMFL